MNIVEVIVVYSAENLSAHIEGIPVTVSGKDLAEVEQRMGETLALYLETYRQMGMEIDARFSEDYDLQFRIDAATFINYYSNIFTKAALSRITGINERHFGIMQLGYISHENVSWRRYRMASMLSPGNFKPLVWYRELIKKTKYIYGHILQHSFAETLHKTRDFGFWRSN